MITITSGEWIADLGAMTCRNIKNKIVVAFEKNGKFPVGKIKDIPMELFSAWAALPDGEKYIEKTVMEAEDVFMRAYFENEIEKNGINLQALKSQNSHKKKNKPITLEKMIEERNRVIADMAPNLIDTTIIFERPQVSFMFHKDCECDIFRMSDSRLDDETLWGNPWALSRAFMENLNEYIETGKKFIVMKYNQFIAMEIGSLYLCIKDELKRPLCVAFYHKGESLTTIDHNARIDEKSTALDTMEYLDFIAKYEIPVGCEITLPFIPAVEAIDC